MRQLLDRQAAAGARVRAQYRPKTISYGSGPAETLDVFSPGFSRHRAGVALPAMIFIHGGNWRVGTKESVSFLAPTFLKHGALFIAPEFDPLPGNTLPGMVDQCRRAILWVRNNAAALGADPERLYIAGHSAGGHVAAVLLATDWERLGAPPGLLKGGLVLSGLCDLEPVVLAAGNRHVKLTPAELIELSPVHRLRLVDCPVIVAWGSGDSPEFRRQGELMARHLRSAGRLAGTYVLDDVNHFEILDVLATDGAPLAAGTLALIG
ncbi:alpha/beta hydrolase fold domain-containing protein [Massilia dura]|uniref:Alpha/beta hydrolase fold domain-containing protein n=2 Tax=Pseudoduganella dura TaxID=321982 RepID=A0A6I3XNR3_9BURK|nr:alpha/beta hydrolase fold domain-containing protein [Pseudoduganella dura]